MVVAILLSDAPGKPMRDVQFADAIVGRGLQGDRYEQGRGTFSTWPQDHELTLVEQEEADAAQINASDLRRNLVTVGVRLNDLVGKRFRIGAVLCEGTRLCEPCAHLEAVTNRPDLCRIMAHKAGLRAVILTGGVIVLGDVFSSKDIG